MTSSRFENGRFKNPGASASKSLRDVVRWQLTAERRPWPAHVEIESRSGLPSTVAPGMLAATFVNHATFVLQSATTTCVTDPMWSERASPVGFAGPRRVHAPGVSMDALRSLQLVLLSHNHYDHLDRRTLAALDAAHQPALVTLRGNERYLDAAVRARVTALDWWESIQIGGTRVTATPAQHFSGRALFDRDRALWGGFILEWDGPTVFFAADTGYWSHFREVHAHCGRPGLALLPIGAYEPRWFMAPAHMNPSDAVRAHMDLGGPPTIGMHFGTFRLTDEAWDDPPRALDAALDDARIAHDHFRAPRPGETFLVDGRGFVDGA
jgi:L-ascorbate metabolism protein UlaG (beta-lactamase superfamily)